MHSGVEHRRRAHPGAQRYPFRDLSEADFREVLEYLAGGGKSLQKQYSNTFGKIILGEHSFQTQPGPVQRDILQNIGVIPSEGMVAVKLKSRTLGQVEEVFLRQLQIGDVFIIAGRPVRLERVGMMECFVTRAEQAIPTVPRWNANKMPLTNKVAEEIVAFRGELRARIQRDGPDPNKHIEWIAERLDSGRTNAEVIARMYAAQFEISDIPSAEFLLVEELSDQGEEISRELQNTAIPVRKKKTARVLPARGQRHYFFHCLVGRAANEALSRALALRLSRLRGGNAVATPDDYGFVLTVRPEQVVTEQDLPALLAPEGFANDLDAALTVQFAEVPFRNAAQTGMMVYRNFFGEQKSVRKLQWSAEVIFNVLQSQPDHVLLREARRDAVHTYVDLDNALKFLENVRTRPICLIPIDRVPPLSFALFATKIKEALLVEDSPRDDRTSLSSLVEQTVKEISERRTVTMLSRPAMEIADTTLKPVALGGNPSPVALQCGFQNAWINRAWKFCQEFGSTIAVPSFSRSIRRSQWPTCILGIRGRNGPTGQMLPFGPGDRLVERLTELCSFYKPRQFVFLGDIVHQAVPVSGIIEDFHHLFSTLANECETNFILGNHDKKLRSLVKDKGFRFLTSVRIGNFLLMHGNEAAAQSKDSMIIMGHERPAISLGDGIMGAKFPCFMISESVLVLPAFSLWAAGTDLRYYPPLSTVARAASFTKAVAICGKKLLPVKLDN